MSHGSNFFDCLTFAKNTLYIKHFIAERKERVLFFSWLSKLDQDDPVGERGRQEGSDEASIHREEPASWDSWPALEFPYQDLCFFV